MIAAAKLKIDFVMKIARKDRRFMNDLTRNPVRTLLESGIDLSAGEIFAIVDVIQNTKLSPLAATLADRQQVWEELQEEQKL
ncbi:MAG: hypothetical protein ACFE0R_09090 [Salinarimonas sp.]